MNLQFLKYFVVLAETQNFTKAADKMYVVQSTFSSGIKKLEEQLDCQLFYRDKRNVNLTKEGSTLLPKAKKILSMWNSIEFEFASNESKKLHIGILNTLLIDAIVPMMKNFQELYGQYQVHITEDHKGILFDQLEKQEIDGIFIEEEHIDQNVYNCRTVFEEELFIAVPTNHPLARKDQLELKALHQIPFIERCNCPMFEEVHEAFSQKGIKTVPVFTAHNNDTVNALIASGVGVSLVAKPNLPVEGTKFIPIADANFKRRIIFVWKKSNVSKALDNFLTV